MIKVLFVCMGNICRSPTAHGVFEQLIKDQQMTAKVYVDSAGTHAYHIGEQPDARSQETARMHGVDLSSQRARKVKDNDFANFDYILAMDSANFTDLMRQCPPEHQHKVYRFLEFSDSWNATDVPDPYYGGGSGFETVYSMVDSASKGLLESIKKHT